MDVIERLVSSVAAVAIAILLFASGFLVCLMPVTTSSIANIYADDVTSVFTRSQLVAVADATREYAFGSHDLDSLYESIAEVGREYAGDLGNLKGTLPKGFPDLGLGKGEESTDELAEAFEDASSEYCFTPDEVEHLDDCNAVAQRAYGVLAIAALLALGCLVACGFIGGKRLIGWSLMAGSIAVLACFVLLGLWSSIDFSSLFESFHVVFFPQGNWSFAPDSLLICALPEGFWTSMGTLWLIVSIILSVLVLLVGITLRRSRGLRLFSRKRKGSRAKHSTD